MATNVHNKALQLASWAETKLALNGDISKSEVCSQVQKCWPSLLPEIQEDIVKAFLAQNPATKED